MHCERSLIDDPVDVIRFGPGLARMPRLLAGTLAAVAQAGRKSAQPRGRRTMKVLKKILNRLPIGRILPAKLYHQPDQLCLRQLANFLPQTQKRSPLFFGEYLESISSAGSWQERISWG